MCKNCAQVLSLQPRDGAVTWVNRKKMFMKDAISCGEDCYLVTLATRGPFFFFVSPAALRHRNKDPAPFWHPVDVFSSLCPIAWQHFARQCRQFRSAYFYAPTT
jgi:hypothetical protein